jgi:hypothetical protein
MKLHQSPSFRANADTCGSQICTALNRFFCFFCYSMVRCEAAAAGGRDEAFLWTTLNMRRVPSISGELKVDSQKP